MKRVSVVVAAFFVGIIFTLIATQGTFRDLRFAFSPSLSFANGATYIGDLDAQGVLNGQGRMTWTNDDEYDGEFLAGLMHGKGNFSSKYSGNYKGDFVRGYIEGRGVLV